MNWDWEKLKEEHNKEKDKPKPKKKKRSNWLAYVYIAMVIMGIFTSFFLLRSFVGWFNNKSSYESKVQQAIIEMVKPEALKDKYKGSTNKGL